MEKKLLSNKIRFPFLISFLLALILLFSSLIALGQVTIPESIIDLLKIPPEIKKPLRGILIQNGNKEPIIGVAVEKQPDIPAEFFEKGRTKYWMEVEYDPEKTEIVRDYLEVAYITLRVWQAHIDESGARRITKGGYAGLVYFQELSNPAIYDGLSGATRLGDPEVAKSNDWLWVQGKDNKYNQELSFGLTSIHYRYASQKLAKIKVYSKDDATNLCQKPEIKEIKQWVDYRKIIGQKDPAGNYRYHLVRRKPLPGETLGEIVGAEDICDGGADWFKAAIVDALNKNNDIFGKVQAVNISYEIKESGEKYGTAVTAETDGRTITFYIAKPEQSAKILRLNLPYKSVYNYYHQLTRTDIIKHEATHTYHNWALANKSASGIKDIDTDKLPAYDRDMGIAWGWQIDSSQKNGFRGDLKSDDSVYIRPKTNITKSFTITPATKNNWQYFKDLIFSNIPDEKPIVGLGEVPNGYIYPNMATVTFYWIEDFSLSYQAKNVLKAYSECVDLEQNSLTFEVSRGNDFVNMLIFKDFLPKVNQLEITYAIATPHHPEEYDCEQTAGGEYVGK